MTKTVKELNTKIAGLRARLASQENWRELAVHYQEKANDVQRELQMLRSTIDDLKATHAAEIERLKRATSTRTKPNVGEIARLKAEVDKLKRELRAK